MSNQMRAFRMIVNLSESVTCKNCGRELKGENLQRLARKGCPQCAGKSFDFHDIPEKYTALIRGAVGR